VFIWRLRWGWSLVSSVLLRSPAEGRRVEEEAGFSFYLFSPWVIYWFCFPLCNIVQAICIDWENAFYTVFHNKVLNVHTDAVSFECTPAFFLHPVLL